MILEKSLLSIFTQPSYWSEYSFSKGTVSAKSPCRRRTLWKLLQWTPSSHRKSIGSILICPGHTDLDLREFTLGGSCCRVLKSAQDSALREPQVDWDLIARRASARQPPTTTLLVSSALPHTKTLTKSIGQNTMQRLGLQVISN